MNTPAPPRPVDELLPPPDPAAVYRVGLAGAALTAAAVGVGLIAHLADLSGPSPLSTGRLVLVGLGAVLAGAAVSLRPGLWPAWLIAAGTALLAVYGLPGHWDSYRLLAGVLAAAAAAGAALAAMPATPRYTLLSLAAVFHFGGILTATTWPDPTPWLTNQVAHRVYMPYLTFLYLRNAYHFYSPEPGPASHLFILLQYELDQPDPATGDKVVHEWVSLPRRDEHYKDPLGLTYYRRLSITEMVSPSLPALMTTDNFEKSEVLRRRTRRGVTPKEVPNRADPTAPAQVYPPIPMAVPEVDPVNVQYRVPQPHITRYLLPSYARHVAAEYSAPGRRVTAMKVYRVEHRIVQTAPFAQGADPYAPITYRPYYYGEYTPDGTLVDPQDEMLYWLVPIQPRAGGPAPDDPEQRNYVDYLSKHAGYEFNWRRIRP